jgi:hypothetical protein
MQTECSAEPIVFGRVEGRPVVAAFDGGALTSDAGGLLLGAADRGLDLVRRLADVSAMRETRGSSSTRSPRSSGSAFSASRSATRT